MLSEDVEQWIMERLTASIENGLFNAPQALQINGDDLVRLILSKMLKKKVSSSLLNAFDSHKFLMTAKSITGHTNDRVIKTNRNTRKHSRPKNAFTFAPRATDKNICAINMQFVAVIRRRCVQRACGGVNMLQHKWGSRDRSDALRLNLLHV